MKSHSGPLVSICIPAYNCSRYIEETLICLCKQTYRNIEIVIVNDGSTDGTAENVKKIIDQRIRLMNVTNGGAAKARNIAYKHSNGEYIVFFDADDYVQPDFIMQQLGKIDGRNDVIVISAWGRFYQNDLKTFRKERIPYNEMFLEDWINCYWYNGNPMTIPGRSIIPKKLIDEGGLWNENLSLNDDLEFYTRLFLKVHKLIINQAAILYYRSGIEGLSSKKGVTANKSLYNSVILSTDLILNYFAENPSIKQSCANLLQSLVYELYPEEKGLVKTVESKIRTLGGSKIPFPSGGYTKFLTFVIGWKLTKNLKKCYTFD
ncbi:glycosyltransferase family 2 protein [Mucilaginibacter sp.]